MEFDIAYVLDNIEWRKYIIEIANYLGYGIDNLTEDEIYNIAIEMREILNDNGIYGYVIFNKKNQPHYVLSVEGIADEIRYELKEE
jgi:hypothetical protein